MTELPETPARRPVLTAERVLRPNDLRDVNEIAVLRALLAHGPASRTRIATTLGLTQGPITRIVARLLERGLIREGQTITATGRGRPTVPIGLVPDAVLLVGAHIGLEHLTIGRTGLDGAVQHERRFAHRGSWATVRRRIAEYLALAEESAGQRAIAVGVIAGGVVDPATGVLLRHDALGWRDVAVVDQLTTTLERVVVLDASVRAHAYADLLFGVAAAYRNFVHVFVGNLLEVAVVVDGRVRPGRDGLAGDLSSWVTEGPAGAMATLTEMLGDQGLLRRAQARGLLALDAGLDDLVALADRPDGAAARSLLLDRAAAVGQLLARLDALLAPEAIVVSSGVLAVPGALAAATATLHELRGPAGSTPAVLASRYGTNPLVSAGAALVLERTLLSGSRSAASSMLGSGRIRR